MMSSLTSKDSLLKINYLRLEEFREFKFQQTL